MPPSIAECKPKWATKNVVAAERQETQKVKESEECPPRRYGVWSLPLLAAFYPCSRALSWDMIPAQLVIGVYSPTYLEENKVKDNNIEEREK